MRLNRFSDLLSALLSLDKKIFQVVRNRFIEKGGSGINDQVNRGVSLDNSIERTGSGDVGHDAEFEILPAGCGMVGTHLVGFALGADYSADREVGGEELREDVGSEEAVCAGEEDALDRCCNIIVECFWASSQIVVEIKELRIRK